MARGKNALAESREHLGMTDAPPVDMTAEVPEEQRAGEATEEAGGGDDGEGEETLDDALGKLGDAVARENSNLDLSEAAHVKAIDRMEAIATEFVMNPRSLVQDARDFLLEQIKVRPKPWSATSNAEQRDVAAACEHAGKELVRKIVEAVASGGRPSIRALLESWSEKDGIKATLKIKTLDEEESLAAVIGLHRAQGKHVLITVASADDHAQSNREASTDPDEPGLQFEAGNDHPADDSDLADGKDNPPDPEEEEEEEEEQIGENDQD